MPTFSNGWFTRFQVRTGIRERVRYGEDSSINIKKTEEEMVIACKLLSTYLLDNIFNCN
jgi:hypothetical protein